MDQKYKTVLAFRSIQFGLLKEEEVGNVSQLKEDLLKFGMFLDEIEGQTIRRGNPPPHSTIPKWRWSKNALVQVLLERDHELQQ